MFFGRKAASYSPARQCEVPAICGLAIFELNLREIINFL